MGTMVGLMFPLVIFGGPLLVLYIIFQGVMAWLNWLTARENKRKHEQWLKEVAEKQRLWLASNHGRT